MFLRTIFILFVFVSAVSTNAQTAVIDSLRKELYKAPTEEDRLTALLTLFEEFQSINRDSLDVYGPLVQQLASRSNNQRSKSLATLAYANWYFRWGWSDSAITFIEPELNKNPVTDEAKRDIYFKLARAKAMYYGSKGKFEQALQVLYKALPDAERYKDTLNIGLLNNTIGSIAIARQKYDEALQWINKAISLSVGNGKFLPVLVPAYLNKGNWFILSGNNDSADYYIDKALPLCRQLQNLNYEATGLRIQANIYTARKEYAAAERSLLKMMEVRKKMSPSIQQVDDNLQLADFYANSGQIDKAINLCKQNLAQGDLTNVNSGSGAIYTNDPRIRLEYLQALSGYYKKAGLSSEYQTALEELLITKDSMYASNSVEAIAELQTRYDVQKKENTILQQKYGLQKKNFLLYGYIILSAVLLVIGITLFVIYRKKQRRRVTAMMEEEKRHADDAIKKAEENERIRIASDLHDNLGAYAASMASNLGYIHLPEADDLTKNALKELGNNSNAIISQLNDTIWVLNKEALHITAISDRIKIFISRLQRSYPEIHLEVKEEISTDYKLPSSHAFHLYRILQEAINNSLKHSKAKNILVKISADQSWIVTVEDDGIGFDKQITSRQSNGLLNMKERSREAGWDISWDDLESGGTVVKIEPTTN